MTEQLANAGTEPAAPAASPDSFSGGAQTGQPSDPQSRFQEAFTSAKEEVDAMSKKRADAVNPPAQEETAAESDAADESTQSETDAVQEQQAKEKPEAAADGLKPPERWPAEWKNTFAKLTPAGQQAMLDQHKTWERGYNQKFEELAQTRKFADDVIASIPKNVADHLRQNNLPPQAGITALWNWYEQSEQNPIDFVSKFIHEKGLDPTIFLATGGADDGADQQAPQQLDPAQIAPFVQPLQEKLAQLEAMEAERQQQAEAARTKSVEAAFEKFVGDTDDSGNPLHPHVDRVADHIVTYLNSNAERLAPLEPRQRLEEAYAYAVMADPELRQEIVSAEAAKKAEALERERLNGRLGAAASIKPKIPSPAPAAPAPTGIRAAFDAARRELG